ncbi:MAG: hypothetical protein NTZ84_01595 [Candidatus Nealsonbacteria bacterium]|nr:hypothetical protein [Candidatus Nealsonbacteria bacterium]
MYKVNIKGDMVFLGKIDLCKLRMEGFGKNGTTTRKKTNGIVQGKD